MYNYVLKHESSKTFNESNGEGFSTQDAIYTDVHISTRTIYHSGKI